MSKAFSRMATRVAEWSGRFSAFMVALTVVLVWAITGPLFGFSETWQLVINTGTTIVTFLMVFLIQNSQNRNDLAVHIKLDEILRSLDSARNDIIDAEQADDEELAAMRDDLRAMVRDDVE